MLKTTTKIISMASLITKPYKPIWNKVKINIEANLIITPSVVVFKAYVPYPKACKILLKGASK